MSHYPTQRACKQTQENPRRGKKPPEHKTLIKITLIFTVFKQTSFRTTFTFTRITSHALSSCS